MLPPRMARSQLLPNLGTISMFSNKNSPKYALQRQTWSWIDINSTQEHRKQTKTLSLEDLGLNLSIRRSTWELIPDRIVCGVRSQTIRKQLLKEKDLTLHRAVQICQSVELSDQHSKELASKTHEEQVSMVTRKRDPHHNPSIIDCRNCGKNHEARRDSCPAYGKQCDHCGKHHFKTSLQNQMLTDEKFATSHQEIEIKASTIKR